MNWFTGVLVYCMIWVVVLLTVLPWGVRPPDAPGAGHEPGAPERPMLLKKFIVTTLIAAALWGVIYLVIDQGWISFRDSVEPFVKPAS
jgi:predicted secreted protein